MKNKISQFLNIVSLSIKNKQIYISKLLNRIFTKANLNKFIIIFTVGFISRAVVCYIYNINVYSDFLHNISLIYYFFFSIFTVLVHEFVVYTDFNIIPSYIINIFVSIFN